jgi:hypothetical protein
MTTGDSANGTTGMAEQVKGTAGQVIDQASDKTAQLAGQVKEQAMPAVQGQKQRAAESLGTTAEALRRTSQHLRDQDQGTVARYMDQAAERVEQFGGYLRGRDLNELVGDAEQFARRQPGLFLGGAFVLGLFGARLLKSSSERAEAAARGQRTGSAPTWPAAYGNSPTSSVSTRARSQGWPADDSAGGRGSTGSVAHNPSEPAWTSRDERASAGLSQTSGYSSPATDAIRSAGTTHGEVAP